MRKLANLDALKREIRQDDVPGLAVPTWDWVTEAFKSGKTDEALKYLDYACGESKKMHDTAVLFVSTLLNFLAVNFGEEQVEKLLRERYAPRAREWLATLPDARGTLIRITESMRGHFSSFTSIEEPDRYILRYDPCGSGGRLLRTSPVGVTRQAHPWSWGKTGVSYYCTHCCLFMQIIPIEMRGYPLIVVQPPIKSEDACTHIIYKKPELVPEKVYTQVGKKKMV